MRNRQPVSASAFPAETRMNQKPKKAKTVKKVKKVQEPKVAPVDEVKVKPHCELFLADLPAPMRSVTTLAGFFHPYGEIANIQIIPVGQKFPEECHKFIDTHEFDETFCAIVEFLTARVAKFVVGVLRKRIEALNFRIGLLKPGLAEEMIAQEQRLLDSLHLPTFQINKTQSSFLNEASTSQYSSEELSEFESRPTKRFIKPLQMADQAYFTGSSETTSDSDFGRYDTSDDDTDLLTLALKNGIKVIRD